MLRFEVIRAFGMSAISFRRLFSWSDKISGEGEIRTPATLAGRPVFETGAFSHSATSPGWGREYTCAWEGGQKSMMRHRKRFVGQCCAVVGCFAIVPALCLWKLELSGCRTLAKALFLMR